MSEIITQSLWITLVSMGLVFAALLLLAGLTSAMTRIFRDREEALTPGHYPNYGRGEEEKARAAALAVAVALAEQAQSTARPLNLPRPAIIGAWQLGMRTRQMTDKSNLSRGKRG